MHPDATQPKPAGRAAFFDIDGTLISTNVVHAYGYYATNEGSLLGIAGRTLATAASIPIFAGLNLVDRKISTSSSTATTRASRRTGC